MKLSLAILCAQKELKKSPLVIFIHGNKSYKEVHRAQAIHLASWGIHSLVVSLPNRKQWLKNGERVKQLTDTLAGNGHVFGQTFNEKKIILAGHSFGGSAVTIASGLGAPISGLILLDPAVVSPKVIPHMKKVDVPVVLLGADPKVFKSRQRQKFFRYIPSMMAEFTIIGSTHDDAQFPSRFATRAFGLDPFTSQNHRETFLQSITVSAISLAATGRINLARTLLQEPIQNNIVRLDNQRSLN